MESGVLAEAFHAERRLCHGKRVQLCVINAVPTRRLECHSSDVAGTPSISNDYHWGFLGVVGKEPGLLIPFRVEEVPKGSVRKSM